MKVLITGAGALLGQGIIRSFRNSELDPTIISVDPSPLSAALYWSDRRYLVPMAKDPTYLDEIKKILDRERPDIVLIGTDVELMIFAQYRKELETEFDTTILVSSPEVISIADDKYLTYKFLKDNGFDYPESGLPGEEERVIEAVGFPLIVKPRVGARSIGVHKVHNREELRAAVEAEDEPVIQECVASADDEYTAGVVVFNGQCTASIVMRRDLRDGNTYRAYVEEFPELNARIQKIGEALMSFGPSNFQFRIDEQDRLKVFEINARFSGTTPLRALAGMNEVEMCLKHLLKDEPIRQPELEAMTILRHWSETVVRPDETRAVTTIDKAGETKKAIAHQES